MHRIQNTTTAATKPTAVVSGTAGYYQPGDIPSNLPATQVTYDWLNSVQEEIANVITSPVGGNASLSLTNDAQLIAAIQLMIANAVGSIQSVPVGTIFNRANAAVPSGYLYCDGSAVSRTTYAALFTAIGVTYGAGNGTSTFNLPDLRGVFLRGLDDGKGYDAGRTIGSYQVDDFKSHSHVSNTVGNDTVSPGGVYVNHYAAGGMSGANGGTETRPKNVAVYPIIKY